MSELDDFPLSEEAVQEILDVVEQVDCGCTIKDFMDQYQTFEYLTDVVRWYAEKKGIK